MHFKPGRISEGSEKKTPVLPADITLLVTGKGSDTSHLSFKWVAMY